MDVKEYMEKYAKIAGMQKEAIPRKMGKKVDFGTIPRKMGKQRVGEDKKLENQDPGYLFLNSGRFMKLMLPPATQERRRIIKEKEHKPLIDMFGRPIKQQELY